MLADIGMGYAIIIAALIAAVGSVTTTWLQVKTRRDIRPPSGGTLGDIAERSHHLVAVNTAGIKTLVDNTEGVTWPPPVDPADEWPPPDAVESAR